MPEGLNTDIHLSEQLDRSFTFRTKNYPVSITAGFVITFGGILICSYLVGGATLLFINSFLVVSLITHEYAHVLECVRLYIPIRELKFTWFGGLVDADFKYAHEEIPVMMAGVIDTCCYLVVSLELLVAFWIFWHYTPLNWAGNPFSQLFNVMLVTVGCVIFPASYNHKRYGLITTDGWGAWLKRELRDELWNDGKIMAQITAG